MKTDLKILPGYGEGNRQEELAVEVDGKEVRTRLARGRERLAQICGDTKKSRKDGQCEIRMMERTRTV